MSYGVPHYYPYFIGEELVTQEAVKYTDQEPHLLNGNAWI